MAVTDGGTSEVHAIPPPNGVHVGHCPQVGMTESRRCRGKSMVCGKALASPLLRLPAGQSHPLYPTTQRSWGDPERRRMDRKQPLPHEDF